MRFSSAAEQFGFSAEHHASVGSTNDLAMAYLREGGTSHHFVIADEQTGGRGRLGRVWVSKPGNLYASLALVDPCDMAFGFQLGFVAALSIHEAMGRVGVNPSRLSLKWPNDVLLDQAKLSGILIEGARLSDARFGAVIGCGINIAHHPEDTPYRATDLASSGIDTQCVDVFQALAAAFRHNLDLYARGSGFAHVRSRWLEHARGLGGPIVVRERKGERSGVFKGLDEDGRLLIEADGVITPVIAGDVYFE